MFEARDRGISIPGNLSVVGFDNLPITEHLQPALTTIDVPSAAIGTATAEALLRHLSEGLPIASQVFRAPFLDRQTTAPPGRTWSMHSL
jgi:LacI family transcriptional regulator